MSVTAAFIMPHPPIIIPSVGKGEERKICSTAEACRQVSREIEALQPETVVVTTPHSVLYADYLHISPGEGARGDFRQFGSAQGALEFRYDTEFVAALTEEAVSEGLPAGTFGEKDPSVDHGALVPLSFVREAYGGFRLVRCSISGLSPLEHYRFGQCIARAAEKLGRKTVLIASGDLSHKLSENGPYGFAPEGPQFDRQVTEAMKTGDFLRFLTFDPDFCEAAAECGLRSFMILAGVFDGMAVNPEFLSYEGPFGVGYAVCAFRPDGANGTRRFGLEYDRLRREAILRLREKEDDYVRLARLSLETRVIEGRRTPVPREVPEEMLHRRAGVFVSLKKDGELRGCIGTILPTQKNIAAEIIGNAVSAGLRDSRFDPVTEEELPLLVYSVDVLEEPEPISSAEELDVKKYGVIVRAGGKCGLLLPNLAGIDTPERQLEIALRKGGISPREAFTMQRFRVVRHN